MKMKRRIRMSKAVLKMGCWMCTIWGQAAAMYLALGGGFESICANQGGSVVLYTKGLM